jgi:hypothetical protein
VTYRSSRPRCAASCAISSTSWTSVSARAALTPRTTPAKNGSEKKRDSGSATISAIESVRRVTRLRAARLGT